MRKAKRRVPSLKTDKAAEQFLLRICRLCAFEFEKNEKQINMRLPAPLLAAMKAKAKERGIPYTRLVREALEHAVSRSAA